MRKRKYNPKRRIRDSVQKDELKSLATKVSYTGNPAHKKHPGDFRLTPPAQPRLNKTLCDVTQIIEHRVALDLLRKGIKLGLISAQDRGGLPQNIWAVSGNGIALEAQLDNVETCAYHGYPMGTGDPLASEIVKKWNAGVAHE